MEYAVVIPTNRLFDAIEPLLRSLMKQTLLPRQIVIVRDIAMTNNEGGIVNDDYESKVKYLLSDYKMTQLDIVDELSTKAFVAGKGASYVRNFGRKQVICKRMMFVDDDNVIDDDGMKKMVNGEWGMVNDKGKENVLIVPMQGDGDSDRIRNAVADGFSFVLCRPRWLKEGGGNAKGLKGGNRYIPITLASSNCLFGSTRVFEQYPFDESLPFVYEDLIMTGQMSTAGVQLLYDTTVCIHHYHGHRSKLTELYINTPERAYYKTKHRIVLVYIIAQHWWQLVLFYSIGLWGHTVWLMLHIFRYAPISQRIGLVGAILRGSLAGIRKVWFMS